MDEHRGKEAGHVASAVALLRRWLDGLMNPPARRRFRADASAMLGLGLVLALALFALLGPWLASSDPNASDFGSERGPTGLLPGPSARHLLGTDPLFRDVLSRVAHGGRLSLTIGVCATLFALLIGTAVGTAAAHARTSRFRRLDDVLMRIVDVALAFPYLLLITAIGVAIDRSDAVTVVAVLGLTGWTGVARITRAKALVIGQQDYVRAARALGASGWRIVLRHVLPGLRGTLLVVGSHAVAQMILAEAVLGYLTVGIDPPQATWGRMLQETEHYVGVQPLLVAVPGLAIVVSVVGFTRLGDGLRDAFDPTAVVPSRWRRGRVWVDAGVLAAALLLLGFAEPDRLAPPQPAREGPAAELVRRGGTLRIATQVPIQTLDPAVAYDQAARGIDDLLFARLVTWDARGQLRGELADMEVLDGGKRYRFVLRVGLFFHDGAPLAAVDVKRSLERTLHPSTPSPGANLYGNIAGFEEFRDGKSDSLAGVVVVDARTVDIQLSEPDATFGARMAMGFAAPVCPSSGPRVDPKAPTPPCGAGPFRLVEHVAGERIELSRFERYHEPNKPYLDGVSILTNVPFRTQRYRFEAGELDFVNELSGIDMARYAADEAWAGQRAEVVSAETQGVFLNTEMAPFDNRHVRRAVSFALDGSVLPKVHAGVAETTRIIPASIPGPPRDEPMRRHDLTAALAEMAQAGMPFDPDSGRGGWPEPIDYITVPNSFEQHAAEIFQQQLSRIGLRIRLRLVSWASWLSLITARGRAPMGWRGWGADYPDPANFFEATLVSSAIRDSDCQNASFFSNAELDRVVERAHREIDPAVRMQLYERAEEIVRDEAPWIPLYTHRSLQLWQPRVRGYQPHPFEPLRLRDVWLADGGGP